LQYGLKNYNNLNVEWVAGAPPTAYFYDESGSQISEVALGDRTFTELLSLFAENSFTPTLEFTPYPNEPLYVQEYGGHRYMFYSTENGLAKASEFAQAFGGYLVTVTSAQEQDFLGKVLNELKIPKTWLGASDKEEEGVWRWLDGPEKSLVFWNSNPDAGVKSYSLWFKGEPNNIEGEHCSMLFPDGWNDISCDVEKSALIIEIGNDPLKEEPVPPVASSPDSPGSSTDDKKTDL